MRTGALIFDGAMSLLCLFLLIYTTSGKQAGRAWPRWLKMLWWLLLSSMLGRALYDWLR
jgi:hypothetical protein